VAAALLAEGPRAGAEAVACTTAGAEVVAEVVACMPAGAEAVACTTAGAAAVVGRRTEGLTVVAAGLVAGVAREVLDEAVVVVPAEL